MMHDAVDLPLYDHAALDASRLRWTCDPDTFAFHSTHDVKPIEGVIGQDAAVEALRFGLEVNAPGQNIFVRGLTGTGRNTLLRDLLETIRPDAPRAPDRAYVHNFDDPARPHLLTFPRGTGTAFRRGMDDLRTFIRDELKAALASDVVREKTTLIERETSEAVQALGKPFDEELREAGLTLVQVQVGSATRPLIVPLIDDKPASPEVIDKLKEEGKLTDEDLEQLKEKIGEFSKRLQELGEKIQGEQLKGRDRFRRVMQEEARDLVEAQAKPLREAYPDTRTQAFLDTVVADVVSEGLPVLDETTAFTQRYTVNLIQAHDDGAAAPVVLENAPSVSTLVGQIDVAVTREEGGMRTPHALIRGGSLLRADGGYLILDARDLLMSPGAWHALVRTLRTSFIQMVPPDQPVPWRVPIVKPEPIPVNVKVVLIGDSRIYYTLDAMDADFPHLFKVLADFEDVIDRTAEACEAYASVLAKVSDVENLPPFDRTAVARLCEHGARIAGQPGKLTMRFGRLADLAREAAFLATKSGQGLVGGDLVEEAVRRTKRRADLPARRYRDRVADGTIRVMTQGRAVGQINGLAVIQAGPLVYGFPQRITATIGPGTAGAINIEREAQLSGAIHNKGFYILGGLLRYLLRTDHPLAFDASVAFEQSYGGIDGDSASGAEMCCLLSALTDLPLRQDLAMTGAIDQVGNILPIGAANEKIEGFFDTCVDAGLTGTQGVLIPSRNVGDLQLRSDVVKACEDGRFQVHAVDTIHEAIGLFTGHRPGHREEGGTYAPDSVLGCAVLQAERYWEMATKKPG